MYERWKGIGRGHDSIRLALAPKEKMYIIAIVESMGNDPIERVELSPHSLVDPKDCQKSVSTNAHTLRIQHQVDPTISTILRGHQSAERASEKEWVTRLLNTIHQSRY